MDWARPNPAYQYSIIFRILETEAELVFNVASHYVASYSDAGLSDTFYLFRDCLAERQMRSLTVRVCAATTD
jgi:hypothetical protein